MVVSLSKNLYISSGRSLIFLIRTHSSSFIYHVRTYLEPHRQIKTGINMLWIYTRLINKDKHICMLNTCMLIILCIISKHTRYQNFTLLSVTFYYCDLIPFLIDRSKRAMFKYCCQNPHNVFVTSGSIGWFPILTS